MTALDIEYVELYVNDKKSSVDYFVSALGFAAVAESRQRDDTGEKDSVLLSQGDVRLIVTTGAGTRDFLEAHGDGIADIALGCDDIDVTRAAAIAAGATPAGRSRVSGFGAVCHTLLSGAGRPRSGLPANRPWIPLTGSGREAERIRSLDHVAVCVEGGALEDHAGFYRAAFGLERYSGEYVDYGDQAMDSIVVRSPTGRVTFTLVAPEPVKGSGQLDAFLDRNGGPGVQHLAFEVDDIVPAVAEFRERGVEFLRTPDTYYDMLATRLADLRGEIAALQSAGALADRDEWGYLFQLFTSSPHERNTLFYELIQRRGARGFGSANIRALYEAVDRAARLGAG